MWRVAFCSLEVQVLAINSALFRAFSSSFPFENLMDHAWLKRKTSVFYTRPASVLYSRMFLHSNVSSRKAPPRATESPWPPKQCSFLVVVLLAFTLPSRLFVCFPVEFSYFQSARARATLSGLSNPIYDPITLKLATTGLSAPDPEYWGVVCLLGGTGN